MARVTYAPLVTAVKGSVGGLTFQNNPSGAIIRARPLVKHASTSRQSAQHSKLYQLLFEWQQLTQTQRDDWGTFAAAWPKDNKFGQEKILTGMNWFISASYWLYVYDGTILYDPPTHTLPPAAPALIGNTSATELKVGIADTFDYSDAMIIVWVTTMSRRNTTSLNQIRRWALFVEAYPGADYDITTYWETATGLNWEDTYQATNNYWVAIQPVCFSSGITGPLTWANVT